MGGGGTAGTHSDPDESGGRRNRYKMERDDRRSRTRSEGRSQPISVFYAYLCTLQQNNRTHMEHQVEIIQINISGEDKPGMTSSLTEILARYDAFILDIGQANIHRSLTLGILFRTTSDKSGNIMKELLFKASELGVMIRFTPISEADYDAWVGRQGKNRYIITLLGRRVTARHIAEVTGTVAENGLNIDAIRRLTGRMPLHEDDRAAKSCI